MPKAKDEHWILLGVPAQGGKALLMDVNRRVARFERSEHAAGLVSQVAQVAIHSLLVWQGARRPGLHWWAEFDASDYVAWLGAETVLHPSVVPDLYRAWRRSLDWLVEEGALGWRQAEVIFDDLCDLEDTLVHLVIDAYLGLQEQGTRVPPRKVRRAS